jgi:succinate dehydrogenase/fumarate reductase flavoprotein subunit
VDPGNRSALAGGEKYVNQVTWPDTETTGSLNVTAFKHDVVIVGAGLAGLRTAVEMPEHADVALISKVYPTRSHSGAAQGGIAAAIGNEEPDSWEWHMYETS